MSDPLDLDESDCQPYVCPFPAPTPGDRWTCPNCGARYRCTRPKHARPWRNRTAPHGSWRLTLRQPTIDPAVRSRLRGR